jgi:hypothetical protein
MKIMKFSRHSLDVLFIAMGLLGCFILYGCGAASLGPQEPLLPTIEGQAKFSDRFQLEEEPFFFYDLFGKELLEGNEVYNYREQKEFDRNGELIVGWTGQLDSERFSAQLDRTILTEDSFRGRHTEFAIGDNMRIKPQTLFPNRYIIYKTEFDGVRWDVSFSQERHLFSLLNSRISNPVRLSDAAANLAPTLGRRNGFNEDEEIRHIENARLIGFRAQGLLGDVFRVGFTYINLHKEHPERVENPLFGGTVANTPPERILVVFRDDSPEDNHPLAFASHDPDAHFDRIQGGVGVAVKEILVRVTTQGLTGSAEEGPDRPVGPDKKEPVIRVGIDELTPVDIVGPEPRVSDDGQWKIAEGFIAMKYQLVFEDHQIDPRQVKSVEFEMVVAGDYNIAIVGFSDANKAPEGGDPLVQEWIKTVDGRIEMPYRDVIEAPGNWGQSEEYTQNRNRLRNDPARWKSEGKPRKIRYRYGAARAAVLYGVDLEGTLFNTFIRAHYSINQKFKQYPTVSKDVIGFSRVNPGTEESPVEGSTITIDPNTGLALDKNGIPTYAETNGERFEARLNGDPNDSGEMGRETAWFINLKQRFGKLFLEETFYHIDPGYTTNYHNFGANNDRDATYSLERTPESTAEVDPFDETVYRLIEDDDDDDDWPDDIDFDGVLPQADDRDQNGILDFQEDFLIFEADPPVFEDLVDLNNNGVIDSLEDDFEPQYEYGIDREGYHITASYDLLDNLTLRLGWLNENEISSRRQNDSKYLHLTYQRDIPDFGTILFQNRFVRANDDIPDYSITLRPGELEPTQESDELDLFKARVNTTTLQFLYSAVPNLTLESKFLVVLQKQFDLDEEGAIALDIAQSDPKLEKDDRVDFMVPIDQVRSDGDIREFPWYPDHGFTPVAIDPNTGEIIPSGDNGLIYDAENWKTRRYEDKTIRNQIVILRAKYEIPLGDLPGVDKIGEDLTLTPMIKYIWNKAFDRKGDEISDTLNPRLFTPEAPEVIEYLRFNRKSREDVMGVRLDYQFTQRMNILGGFQYRKFTNRDGHFKQYLDNPIFSDIPEPLLFRPDIRTRILEIQAINRGEWLGFNIVILAGFRRTTILLEDTTSNTTFVRAMMGF